MRAGWLIVAACACWPSCGSNNSPDAEPAECATLDLETCASTLGCAVEGGQALDEARGCFGPFSDAYCCDSDMTCEDLDVYVMDPDGRCWLFSGGCGVLPDGWEERSCSDAQRCE